MGLPVYLVVFLVYRFAAAVNDRFDLRFVESVLAGQHAAVEDAGDEDSRRYFTVEDDVAALFDSAQSGPRWAMKPAEIWIVGEPLTAISDLNNISSSLRLAPGLTGISADALQVCFGLS
jgi:hypothetical protein